VKRKNQKEEHLQKDLKEKEKGTRESINNDIKRVKEYQVLNKSKEDGDTLLKDIEEIKKFIQDNAHNSGNSQ